MRMERLLGMVKVLSDTRKMTIQELADYFQVSKRTVFRDLSTLSRMGILVVSCREAGEHAAAATRYTIDKKGLSKDETLRRLGAFFESREKVWDEGQCPCRRDCPYHGDCKACVAVHRARKVCVPDCLRHVPG